jgi:formylmethanofuran dehydrogenase subunit C
MQIVKLSLKKPNKIPIEADNVNPDNFAGKTEAEIKEILVLYGNGQCPLGKFFNVNVAGSDSRENTKIVFEGDVSRVKRIGQNMSAGEIEINGSVDMHCGFGMKGGKIVINGDADSWLGCEMTGGEIILNGNASYYVGSGYRGEACGMRGGKITVNGNARDYLGEHMCGGEIIVKGNVGLLPAISNNGGKIVIEGSASMPASEMKNGTVIIKGKVFDLLPSYKEEGTEELEGVIFRKFAGDVNVGGKGILLIMTEGPE